jgi:hypothetical protein
MAQIFLINPLPVHVAMDLHTEIEGRSLYKNIYLNKSYRNWFGRCDLDQTG